MNVTITGISEELANALRGYAEASNRSLSEEIILRLSRSVSEENRISSSLRSPEPPEVMADGWKALAVRWKSDWSVEGEIAALYDTRSPGRDINLTW